MHRLYYGGLTALLMVLSFGVAAANSPSFTVNLLSSLTPIDTADHKLPAKLAGYRLYTTEFEKDGRRWYRLRLGVFTRQPEARAGLSALRARYPGAWIDRAAPADHAAATVALPVPNPAPASAPPPKPAPRPVSAVVPVSAPAPAQTPASIPAPVAVAATAQPVVRDDAKSPAAARPAPAPIAKGVAVNLLSSLEPIAVADHRVPPALADYRLYVTEFHKDGRRWYRLRLGVFASSPAANAALKKVRVRYPSAWLDRATIAEQTGAATVATTPASSAAPATAAAKPAISPRKATPAANASLPVGGDGGDVERRYVINLAVDTKPFPAAAATGLAALRHVRVYSTSNDRRGNQWHFLRAGFFASRAEAEALLPRVQDSYPDARVMKITRYELAQMSDPAATPAPVPTPVPATPRATAVAATGSRSMLLESARVLMVQGDYEQAIALYQRAVDEGDAAASREAQELLGLAYERRGDLQAARAEYGRFLELYPQGEDAERVYQRLAGIDTAHADLQARRREAKERPEPPRHMLYGSLAAIYRRDTELPDAAGQRLSYSALTTYLDVTGRVRNGDYDSRLRFTGSHRNDFLTDTRPDDSRVSTLYADVLNKRRDWSVRAGRQSSSAGGVLGRFDGIFGGMRLSPRLRLNAVAGYPVETTAGYTVDQDRYFAGLSADLTGLAPNWEFQLYGIQQYAAGRTDRSAVGGEARYFQPGRTFFSLLDYDVHYGEINTLMLLGSWSLNDATSINMMYDRRMSPSLTTSNALQGQTATTLDALAQTLTSAQIEQLALDRSAVSQTVMAGVAHTLNDRYQVTADITATQISATPESGGVAAMPASGTDYYLSGQLIGQSIVWPGDLGIIGLRFGRSQMLDSAALSLTSRYNSGNWQISPRVQTEYRQDKTNDLEYWTLSPSLLASYRRWKSHSLEGEVGAQLNTLDGLSDGYYFSLSYRWDFN